MEPLPFLVGMVHLAPLPGAPGFGGDLGQVVSGAQRDATELARAGFHGVLVENFGDVPFYADDAPKETIAAMAVAVDAIGAAADLPVGVNVLRNDGLGAIAVAAATRVAFIRVNVLTGVMFTDQGTITGRAADLVRARDRLAPETAILADVFVKHATPPAGLTLEDAAIDLVERGGADGVIVSGSGTGKPPDVGLLGSVRSTIGDMPLYVGSGANNRNAAAFLEVADGLIVGTSIKKDGVTTNPVDPGRAAALVASVRR